MRTIPTIRADAINTIRALLQDWILVFGIPRYIVSDQGKEFMNKDFFAFMLYLGIGFKPRQHHNPRSNGMAENRMQYIGKYLQKKVNAQASDWSLHVSNYAFPYNSAKLTDSEKSPHEIMFHTKPQIPLALKLGMFRDIQGNCTAEPDSFCEG
jgi:hypothetical protein